jgi:hypothetical protein
MPLARISVPSFLSPAKVRALADAVHHGLVTTCDVVDENRFQLVSSYPPGAMILDPTFPFRVPDLVSLSSRQAEV